MSGVFQPPTDKKRQLWEQLEKEGEDPSVFEFYGDSYEVYPKCRIVDEEDACTTDEIREVVTYVEAIVRRVQQSSATIQEVAEQEQKGKENGKTTTWEKQKIHLQQGKNAAKKKAKMVQLYQMPLLWTL
uniref:Uncharacterized protein n=1 Tax=Glossina austeni TaxID=7395 RepID=A0A1A9USK5_GLOAU